MARKGLDVFMVRIAAVVNTLAKSAMTVAAITNHQWVVTGTKPIVQ